MTPTKRASTFSDEAKGLAEEMGMRILSSVTHSGTSYFLSSGDRPELVLKLTPSRRAVYHAAFASRMWRERGVPVPEVLRVGELNDARYIVTRYVNGVERRAEELSLAEHRDGAAIVGSWLARMHDVEMQGYGVLSSKFVGKTDNWGAFLREFVKLDRAAAAGYLTPQQQAHAEEVLADVQSREVKSRLLHADVGRTNVLYDGSTPIAILDPRVLAGDPLWDLASFRFFAWRSHQRLAASWSGPPDELPNTYEASWEGLREGYEAHTGETLEGEGNRLIHQYETIIACGKIWHGMTKGWRGIEYIRRFIEQSLGS